MANPTSIFDFANEDLATFLAKVVSDGTQADVFNTLKVDNPGEEALATDIDVAGGQLLSNGVDDFIQSSYGPIRNVSLGNGGMVYTTGSSKTAGYAASAGELVRYSAAGGTFTVDFPATPQPNERVGIVETAGDATAITLDADVNTVIGSSGSSGTTVSEGGAFASLVWEFSSDDSTWYLVWNAAISGGTPSAHAASHENGGSDEINVGSLSGVLADDQPPIPTAGVDTNAIHKSGSGEIAGIAAALGPVGPDTVRMDDSQNSDAAKSVTLELIITKGLPPSVATATASANAGSTNTRIRRWTTRIDNSGSGGGLTWTDSATNGSFLTVTADGIISVSVTIEAGASSVDVAINEASSLSNVFDATHIRAATQAIIAGGFVNLCWTGFVAASHVIWVSTSATAAGLSASATLNQITATQFGKYAFG